MASGGDRLMAGAGGILSYFVRHRTIANLLLFLMIGAGLFAWPNMRAQYFPDVVVDGIDVTVVWDGAGAEAVDQGIVQVLEPTLLAVEGVTGSESRSTEGRARIELEFAPGTDIDRAAENVQAAVDAASNLPDNADEPELRRGGWSDRVTDVVITGPVSVDQLGRFADEMVIRLFEEGVTQATVRGIAAPSTIIEVPQISLIEHDIGLSDIAARIREEATGSPAGDVSGAARVRTGIAKRSAEEIAAITLRSNPDGSTLTIGDVANVRVEGADRGRAYFVGDNPAVQISVVRSATGDAIGLQESVELVAAELAATLPAGTTIDLVNARAEQITGRLDLLFENGLMGLGLVVILLFLFLNARTAFWVAMGIPAAMFAAIALMYVTGVTINMISLFALILTLGIVVDDAIVVGEHADYRARVLGEPPKVAAENAAKRMFSPVFSATLTTVIAFFGLVAVGGRFGDLIADIPFTVIVVLLASLMECFLILPHHLSHSIGADQGQAWYDAPSRFVNRGFAWFSLRVFRPFMALVIRARYPVIAAVVLILATQVTLFIRGDVRWQFFSSPEQGEVTGNFAMLPGASRADTVEMMREMQRAVAATAQSFEDETGADPVTYVVSEIGGNAGRGISGADQKEPDQLGAVSISLTDADSRPFSSSDFVERLQETVVQHPRAETVSFRRWGGGPGGDSLDVQMFGADAITLKNAAEALKSELAQFPEISGLEDTLPYDKEELSLELTPQGQALGLNIDTLGRTLRDRLGGIEAASFPDGVRSATVRVELPDGELEADFLERMQVRTDTGVYVPLADVVSVTSRTGFSTVQRENGIPLLSVIGDLADDDPDRAAQINQIINDTILPDIQERFGIQTQLSGLSQQEADFLNDARTALILVLAGIYLSLAWIFGSWTRPMVVMAIIPFGLVGTIYGHNAWGIPMSLFTVVGMIGMVGIIINDSIVLVTTIDEYAQDRGLVPAIIDGATNRLRPVLLTTLTTVLGLSPLLYEGSIQAEFLKPTVVTLVYGLGFGMVLVLLVVPSLIAMQADFARQVTAARRALRGRRRAMWLPAGLGAVAAVALFSGLVLPVLLFGTGWAAVMDVMPILGDSIGAALGAYLVALALVCLLIYVIGLATFGLRRRAT
ncbi:efflux RND transporter permease subunit [Loktanella sp. SALINAS62]|uniref:efflux RND transporter permease subunit n=1 Tax=Loktanella sp. SALINAS62 TaxID=2706124 RepID=UPI001B8D9984|nr:efflux RND transporter permease subunit [Loktanella sp. SALINAS62]MBS1301008.1 efflux RND transporter permease subunit [Loktanella sp. SALINAS62]